MPLTETLHVPGAITVKLMNPPAGRPLQGLHVRRRNQRPEYPPQALHEVAAQLAAVIVSNEAQQAPAPDPIVDKAIMRQTGLKLARGYLLSEGAAARERRLTAAPLA